VTVAQLDVVRANVSPWDWSSHRRPGHSYAEPSGRAVPDQTMTVPKGASTWNPIWPPSGRPARPTRQRRRRGVGGGGHRPHQGAGHAAGRVGATGGRPPRAGARRAGYLTTSTMTSARPRPYRVGTLVAAGGRLHHGQTTGRRPGVTRLSSARRALINLDTSGPDHRFGGTARFRHDRARIRPADRQRDVLDSNEVALAVSVVTTHWA
jgi:hypothetical protein